MTSDIGTGGGTASSGSQGTQNHAMTMVRVSTRTCVVSAVVVESTLISAARVSQETSESEWTQADGTLQQSMFVSFYDIKKEQQQFAVLRNKCSCYKCSWEPAE